METALGGSHGPARRSVPELRRRLLSLAVLGAAGTLFLLPPVVAALALAGVLG